ncbi:MULTISPECIES: hypothetical protein [Legionella]|uniref:Uncharacterized protein n=1 Tax=Legionella drozanskii LLAP-1 TaxID=1212489 RepID=A0A0W0SLM8_9GAMM|nr:MULTISPECIES: hypothetical protein [Legionella]KTC84243.1 hypothetical protein Ldro_3049 [Legionella drozanskii LLAP-1]PJE07208.1 MAG: hypothetical protein CK430_14410 [Legionella sp.]
MFKQNTVFVLGAGASYPYGFPLGKDLMIEIIQNIENDSIYLPMLKTIAKKYYWNKNCGKLKQNSIENPY